MSKQPTIHLKTVGGLDVELCVHRDDIQYSAALIANNTTVAFFVAHDRCELSGGGLLEGVELWLNRACITLTADSAEQCAQFLADTTDYRGSKA